MHMMHGSCRRRNHGGTEVDDVYDAEMMLKAIIQEVGSGRAAVQRNCCRNSSGSNGVKDIYGKKLRR